MKETIDFCKGSNGGNAIYIKNKNGGYRVHGSKCWGRIITINSLPITIDGIDKMIISLRQAKERMISNEKEY